MKKKKEEERIISYFYNSFTSIIESMSIVSSYIPTTIISSSTFVSNVKLESTNQVYSIVPRIVSRSNVYKLLYGKDDIYECLRTRMSTVLMIDRRFFRFVSTRVVSGRKENYRRRVVDQGLCF